MTVAERRAALEKNSTAKMIWIVLLVLEGLAILFTLIALVGVTALAGALSGSGALTGLVLVIAILGLGLGALIFFGVLRLERWVQWLAWINAILSLPSLFSRSSFYSALLPILVAIGYTYIMRSVYPKSNTTIPPTTPPAPPAA